MKNLAKRLAIGTFGLAGLVSQGCETPGDTALVGAGLSVFSHGVVSPKRAAALATAGQGLQTVGSVQALEKSGADVNVYVGESRSEQQAYQQQRVVKGKAIDIYDYKAERIGSWIAPPPSFTCTGYEDLNDDGYIGKDELYELRSYFTFDKSKNDSLHIKASALWHNVLGRRITGKVTETRTGRIIKAEEIGEMKEHNPFTWLNLDFYRSDNYEGIHEYTAEWLLNGKIIPTRTISFFIDYGRKKEGANEDSTAKVNAQEE